MTDLRRPELLSGEHELAGFDCGVPLLNQWLVREARRAQQGGTARTYVWADKGRVIAYFAVCPTRLVREELSSSQAGGVSVVPAYLLAKLALDRSLHGKGHGADLLIDALTAILHAADSVGGRIVVVDAIDDNAAAFYRRHDFAPVKGSPHRLVAKIETVRKALGEADPLERPGGLGTVGVWIDALRADEPSQVLWLLLDDPLRLALAQGWITGRAEIDPEVARRDRDDLAHALSPRDASHPLFAQMLGDLHERWRGEYSSILGEAGSGVLNATNLIAPDMEMVVLTAPEYAGMRETGDRIPARCFITRYLGSTWIIAALSWQLPEPGWPPTEREVPAGARQPAR